MLTHDNKLLLNANCIPYAFFFTPGYGKFQAAPSFLCLSPFSSSSSTISLHLFLLLNHPYPHLCLHCSPNLALLPALPLPLSRHYSVTVCHHHPTVAPPPPSPNPLLYCHFSTTLKGVRYYHTHMFSYFLCVKSQT